MDLLSTVVELEERLRQAMLYADASVLDELISPDLVFTNHLGQFIKRRDDILLHQSGALRLQALEPSEQRILIKEGFVVVSVLMDLLGTMKGAPFDLAIRYTRVWAVTSGGTAMQLIAGHASAMPKKLRASKALSPPFKAPRA